MKILPGGALRGHAGTPALELCLLDPETVLVLVFLCTSNVGYAGQFPCSICCNWCCMLSAFEPSMRLASMQRNITGCTWKHMNLCLHRPIGVSEVCDEIAWEVGLQMFSRMQTRGNNLCGVSVQRNQTLFINCAARVPSLQQQHTAHSTFGCFGSPCGKLHWEVCDSLFTALNWGLGPGCGWYPVPNEFVATAQCYHP